MKSSAGWKKIPSVLRDDFLVKVKETKVSIFMKLEDYETPSEYYPQKGTLSCYQNIKHLAIKI